MLGGRAAERIIFDTVTTGAANDIERATAMARAMVTQYGMSEKFGLMALESVEDRYLSGHTVLNCGQETATGIDQEVMGILKTAYDKALKLLEENQECLNRISAFLIEKETITGKEFMKIFREVKGIEEPEEDQQPAETDAENEGGGNKTLEGPAEPKPVDVSEAAERDSHSAAQNKGIETIASRESSEDK